MEDRTICPEHEEELKLFCVTDQRFVCIICKHGDEHRGHRIKPVMDAAKPCKEDLIRALEFLSGESRELNVMISEQTAEISKAQVKSEDLLSQISADFQAIHNYLWNKEKAIKTQLEMKEGEMLKNLSVLEDRLNEVTESQQLLTSAVEMEDPAGFLQWWADGGLLQVETLKVEVSSGDTQSDASDSTTKFKSRVEGLRVAPNILTLGPYESMCPILVWRDMLESLKEVSRCSATMDPKLKLSLSQNAVRVPERRNVFSRFQRSHNGYSQRKMENLREGQYYWEVDVREEPGWEHGLTVRYYPQQETSSAWEWLFSEQYKTIRVLLKSEGVYVVNGTEEVQLNVEIVPRRLGMYLNCEQEQISFCNADNMSIIHTVWCENK